MDEHRRRIRSDCSGLQIRATRWTLPRGPWGASGRCFKSSRPDQRKAPDSLGFPAGPGPSSSPLRTSAPPAHHPTRIAPVGRPGRPRPRHRRRARETGPPRARPGAGQGRGPRACSRPPACRRYRVPAGIGGDRRVAAPENALHRRERRARFEQQRRRRVLQVAQARASRDGLRLQPHPALRAARGAALGAVSPQPLFVRPAVRAVHHSARPIERGGCRRAPRRGGAEPRLEDHLLLRDRTERAAHVRGACYSSPRARTAAWGGRAPGTKATVDEAAAAAAPNRKRTTGRRTQPRSHRESARGERPR